MKVSSTDRVTIIAIGVEDYKFMPVLRGPTKDVENLYQLLVTSPKTALYRKDQFLKVINPTASQIRELVSAYTYDRTALGDILIFYFSGHSTAVGHKDFGFCTIDTKFHAETNAVLPLTAFRFSELLESLSVVDVAPVIIVDACYSGKAGDALVAASTATGAMQEKIKTTSASNHALLCSCSELQTSINNHMRGGLFSRGIFEIANRGILKQKQSPHLLGLQQIYHPLREFIEQEASDSSPRLYLGDTLLEFPFVKNVKYSRQKVSFGGDFKSIITELWNQGNPIELQEQEILNLCGQGAYCNHNKLSLDPWQLVEDSNTSSKRKLTKRGLSFAQGKIKIPKSINKDPVTEKWIATANTMEITIDDITGRKQKQD